jgi:hypothetical protein
VIHKVLREGGQLSVLALSPSIFDGHILTLDVAKLPQALNKCRNVMHGVFRRAGLQKANQRDLRLLRSHHEGVSGNTAKKSDKCPSSHVQPRPENEAS